MRLPQTRREKEIWHACEMLWQQPPHLRKLTGDAIQAQLLALNYKKGSPNEVYRYRRTWQETRGLSLSDQHHETGTITSPPTLPDPINRAVSLVRDEIFSEAEQNIKKIIESFEQERQVFEEKIQALEAQVLEIKAYNQKLHETQTQLESEIKEKNNQIDLYLSDIKILCQKNQDLENNLTENQHAHALLLEKLAQESQKVTLLQQAHTQEIDSLTRCMTAHQEKCLQQLDHQHGIQIEQSKAAQATVKDLMEQQRHQWIQQLDNEKTAYKKLQAEHLKTSQLLEKRTTELLALQDKSDGYEALLKVQSQQVSSLEELSRKIHHVAQSLSSDTIATLIHQNNEGMFQSINDILNREFQAQKEHVFNLFKDVTLTQTEPSTSITPG